MQSIMKNKRILLGASLIALSLSGAAMAKRADLTARRGGMRRELIRGV